jgi:preprotein translocase subunit SecD
VTKQGASRIVVELPGVDDPNEAIRVLGATATVEFRLVDQVNDAYEAQRTKRIPLAPSCTRCGAPAVRCCSNAM